MSRDAALGLAFALALGAGCVTPHEEPSTNDVESESKREDQAPTPADPAAAPPAGAAEADEVAAPSLEQMQRELASNNAKLRELGVELPGAAEDGEREEDAIGGTKKEATGAGQDVVAPQPQSKSKQRPKTKGDAGKSSGASGKASSEAPSKSKDRGRDKAPGRELGDDSLDPEQAKAAPLTPDDLDREQDAAGRCQQICDLSAITCDIGDQICELADRHAEEEDYVSACERAAGDCDAAKEACDACTE